MKPFEFSHIFVIESLRLGDDETGTELFNDVIRPRMMQIGLENQCELIRVNSKQEFLDAIEHIRQLEIHHLANPIIHFEMHGDEDGLQLENDDYIDWPELQFYLLQLNGISGNNLFVSMATCFGGYIHKTINPGAWAPFWGFAGPFDEVFEDEVILNYSAFYNEFLQSRDFNAAIDALNAANPGGHSPFRFLNTEFVFQRAYDRYELYHLTPERVDQRVEAMFAECRPMPAFNQWDDQMIRDFGRHLIVNEGENMKRAMMRKFFLVDKFPEHEQYYEGLG